MKLLFVTYDYLPVGSAEATLLSKLIEPLKKHGHQIDVLTTKCDLLQADISVSDETRIYRVVSSRAISIRGSLKKCKPSVIIRLAVEKVLDLIEAKNKHTYLSTCLSRDLYKGMVKFNLSNYDAIIPVCAYFETYVASKKYISKMALTTKLVLYQIDPLSRKSESDSAAYSARLDLEKELSNGAITIITTDTICRQKADLNLNVARVFALEFPSVVDMTFRSSSHVTDKNAIRAVYAGYMYSKIRNPEYSLRLFSSLKESNTKLYIIGSGSADITDNFAKKEPNKIACLGVMPLEQTLEYIESADILLNIGNSDISFIPSKIFDYISTGKAIVNIYKSKDCPTLRYFEKYSNSVSIYEDADNFEENLQRLEKFILSNCDTRLQYEEIQRNFYSCTAEFVANEFSRILINEVSN